MKTKTKTFSSYLKEDTAIQQTLREVLQLDVTSDDKSEEEKHVYRKQEQENDRYKLDTATREKLKKSVFKIAICWLIFTVLIVVLQGIEIKEGVLWQFLDAFSFHLSDVVMSTFLGGTTVTVTSLLVIIIKGLFKEKQ